jgi:hypothetical protein
VDGVQFWSAQGKVVVNVPLGDDESVAGRDGVFVGHGEAECVLKEHSLGWHLTEYATDFSMLVGLDHFAEIGVISVSLHGVARIAKGLEVAGVITATLATGDNVIDFECFDICGNAAKVAAKFGSLQDLVPNRSGYIPLGHLSMLPDSRPASFLEFLQFPLAQPDQFVHLCGRKPIEMRYP